MMNKYSLSDDADLASKKLTLAANATHDAGYEIEAFTFLFECIRLNMIVLEFLETKAKSKNKYKIHQQRIKQFLPHKTNNMLKSFRLHRNEVIHEMILNRNFDYKFLSVWFQEGQAANKALLRRISRAKRSNIYRVSLNWL